MKVPQKKISDTVYREYYNGDKVIVMTKTGLDIYAQPRVPNKQWVRSQRGTNTAYCLYIEFRAIFWAFILSNNIYFANTHWQVSLFIVSKYSNIGWYCLHVSYGN